MARTVIYRTDGGEEVVPSKLVTTLHAGDRVVFETAGGGGYGDPGSAHRASRCVLDLADGKISPAGAAGLRPGPQERRPRACRGAREAWAGSDTG